MIDSKRVEQNKFPALSVGFNLNGYTIGSVMGQNDFGITYRAQEKTTDRKVVIREFFPLVCATRNPATLEVHPKTGQDEKTYERILRHFIEEAAILTRLEHTNIVHVLSTFEELNTAYYVMKPVTGNELSTSTPEPNLMDEERLLPILQQLLSALNHLHSHQLLHRDIKPSNIILTPDGAPVLIDFALAQYSEDLSAPEQDSQNKEQQGPWSDLYSLGATCYSLITGQALPHWKERAESHSYSPLSQREDLLKRYSASLLSSIDKALVLPVKQLWQSAEEWSRALAAPQSPAPAIGADKNVSHPRRRGKIFLSGVGVVLLGSYLWLGYTIGPEYAVRWNTPTLLRAVLALPGTNADKLIRERGDSLIHYAAESGYSDCVQALIDAGANINTANDKGYFPVHLAAAEGNSDSLQLLMAAGADVNKMMEDNRTPLHVAALHGQTTCVKILIKAGADVNKTDKEGKSPLICAAFAENVEIIQDLISAGAIVNIVDKKNNRPLHVAVSQNNIKCVQALITAGANLNLQNEYRGDTPLHIAAGYGYTQCAQLIIASGANINSTNSVGNTPLHEAAKYNQTECVQALIEAGADVNKGNNTPLSEAVQKGHIECIQLLLYTPGIDINCLVNWFDDTALHYAVKENRADILSLFIKAGADVNIRNKDGKTPLWLAVEKERFDFLQLLVAAGANVNEPLNNRKETLLHHAIHCKNIALVKQIISVGANVNIEDISRTTPLMLAVRNNLTECVKLLIDAGANLNLADGPRDDSPLILAVRNNLPECVKLLVESGADLNLAGFGGDTPLILAVRNNHPECVKLLVESGADLNLANFEGNTPLILAVRNNHPEYVKLLVESGADLNLAGFGGDTPLILA
ncbi:MAG: ankyrin repeat domain-containing protein, partial [Akkermansia sp.]|nr:ankyrin repeat domain-containing protein [Akkermansia sp.]